MSTPSCSAPSPHRSRTRAQVRLPVSRYTRMVISVADIDGTLLAHYRMPDSLFDAVDVAPAKARNVVYFNSSDPNARNDLPGIPAGTFVTGRAPSASARSRSIRPASTRKTSRSARAMVPALPTNVANVCSQGSQAPNNESEWRHLLRRLDAARAERQTDRRPRRQRRRHRAGRLRHLSRRRRSSSAAKQMGRSLKINGARLPMFKFPRRPEGVTECGGKPCS